MDSLSIQAIKYELMLRETSDLVEIWVIHDPDLWTEEAYEAIRQILASRLEILPRCDNRSAADRFIGQVHQLLDAGQLDQALDTAELAVQSAAHYGVVYNVKGKVLDDLGRVDEAIAAYQQALRFDPGLADAKRSLRYAQKEAQKISSPAGRFRIAYFELFATAWGLLWKSKYIWIISVLSAAVDLTILIILPGLLYCAYLPFNFWITCVLTASLTLVIDSQVTGSPILLKNIWRIANRAVFRMWGLALTLGGVLAIPTIVVLILLLFLRAKPLFSIFLIYALVIIYLIAICIYMLARIDTIVMQAGVFKSISNGMRLLSKNFTQLLLVSISTILFWLILLYFPKALVLVLIGAPLSIHAIISLAIPSEFGRILNIILNTAMVILSKPFILGVFILLFRKQVADPMPADPPEIAVEIWPEDEPVGEEEIP